MEIIAEVGYYVNFNLDIALIELINSVDSVIFPILRSMVFVQVHCSRLVIKVILVTTCRYLSYQRSVKASNS